MTRTSVRILIPSSDRKCAGGSRAFTFDEAQGERDTNRFPSLTRPRREAVNAFLSAINGGGHAERVLGLSGERLDEVTRMNLGFRRAPLQPVFERERGSLFRALQSGDQDAAMKKRVQDRVLVVCPLLGVLAPTDLVPEYRCPVGAQIPGLGSLHAFWKPQVTRSLTRLCRGRVVFSFLTGRLQALWPKPTSASSVIQIRFARRKASRLFPENAASGRLAGELARDILENDVHDLGPVLEHRSRDGHAFSEADSDVSNGVVKSVCFVR